MSATAVSTPNLLTRRQAAQYVGLAEQTLAVWAMDGRNLPFIKAGRAVRYRREDLDEFLRRRTVGQLPAE